MVEDRHAKFLAIHLAREIHPVGALPPALFLGVAPGAAGHQACRFFEWRSQTDIEHALFGIPERRVSHRAQRDIEIDRSLRAALKSHGPVFRQQNLPGRVEPVEQDPRRAVARRPGLAQPDRPALRVDLRGVARPEVVPVHVGEGEREALMMRMVFLLPRRLRHRVLPRNDLPVRRPQRVQERLPDTGTVEQVRERFAVDHHREPVGMLLKRHLRHQRRHRQRQDEQSLYHDSISSSSGGGSSIASGCAAMRFSAVRMPPELNPARRSLR